MNLNLDPGAVTLPEMKKWLKQAHELVWRRSVNWVLLVACMAIPYVLLKWLFGVVLNPIADAEDPWISLVGVALMGIPFISLNFVLTFFLPIGLLAMLVAERADHRRPLHEDLGTELSQMAFMGWQDQLEAGKPIVKQVVLFVSFMMSLMAIMMAVILFANGGQLPADDVANAAATVPPPEPIPLLKLIHNGVDEVAIMSLVQFFVCPYLYALLYYKGLASVDATHDKLRHRLVTDLRNCWLWLLPYGLLLLAILLANRLPLWHPMGWAGVVLETVAIIYFWAFGYVVARDKFLGIGENQKQESKVRESDWVMEGA